MVRILQDMPASRKRRQGRDIQVIDLGRREFLHQTGMAVAGFAVASCTGEIERDKSPGAMIAPGPHQRIAVVGAGVAGLCAAYELMRAGHDVIVLEARNRVGGRVFTIRTPFTDGLFAEAGAARIPPDHALTLAYARYFRLELDPFYPGTGKYLRLGDGARTQVPAGDFLSEKRDFVKVRGGMDRLPEAFAAALGTRVLLGTPVAAIKQTTESVLVHAEDTSEFSVERVLCTVPLPVLGRVRFEPPLSQAKVHAIEGGFDYRPATRIFVEFRERFWLAEGSNGWGETDWPEEIWHPSWDLPGPEGLLLSYVRDERALELDALDPEGRVARVLQHWEDVFGGVGALADRWLSHSWAQDPWSGGAWAIPTPIQEAELGMHVRRAEGRVHFAGEHASDWPGWMQGALSSGLRAAREINEAPVGRTVHAAVS